MTRAQHHPSLAARAARTVAKTFAFAGTPESVSPPRSTPCQARSHAPTAAIARGGHWSAGTVRPAEGRAARAFRRRCRRCPQSQRRASASCPTRRLPVRARRPRNFPLRHRPFDKSQSACHGMLDLAIAPRAGLEGGEGTPSPSKLQGRVGAKPPLQPSFLLNLPPS